MSAGVLVSQRLGELGRPGALDVVEITEYADWPGKPEPVDDDGCAGHGAQGYNSIASDGWLTEVSNSDAVTLPSGVIATVLKSSRMPAPRLEPTVRSPWPM